MQLHYKQGLLTFTVFSLLIASGTLIPLFQKDNTFSETENRYLKTAPKPSFESIQDTSFMADYESYFSDQFFLRDQWITLKTDTERLMLKQESNGVYFGKDGYLLSRQQKEDYTSPLSQNNLTTLSSFIQKETERLGKGHVKALIAPTATQVLSDKLPALAPNFNQEIYLNQLQKVLPENSFVSVLPTLLDNKDSYIYYRTDHHWTSYGAFLAYKNWAASCGIPPYPASDFKVTACTHSFLGTLQAKVNTARTEDSIELYENMKVSFTLVTKPETGEKKETLFDLAALKTKDKYQVFLGGNEPLVKIITNDAGRKKEKKKLLLIKDSYANCFAPLAAGHFGTTYLVDLRYYNEPVSELIEKEGITDILVLYNVSSFATDSGIVKMGL